MYKHLFILCLSFFLMNNLFAQTGPGGVGNSSSLDVWLRSTDISVGDGNEVTVWADTSGNDNDYTAFAGSGGSRPVLDSLGINGQPGVLFSGDAARFEDDDGENYLNGQTSFTTVTLIQSDELATIDVGIFDSEDPNGGDNPLTWRYDNDGLFGGGDNVIKIGLQTNDGDDDEISQLESSDNTHTVDPQLIIVTWSSADSMRLYLDGQLDIPTYHQVRSGDQNGSSTVVGSTSGASKSVIGRGPKDNGSTGWDGYIVEYAFFNNAVNELERIFIENYMAAKYRLTITNDLYVFENSHGNDVAGVGQRGSDEQLEASSTKTLNISTVGANLDDGDYVLFGHDNADASSWSTAEQPLGDVNFERLAREWRVDLTGTPGSVTLSIDTTTIPAKSTDYDFYYLWTDNDGDFSTGATPHLLTLNGSNYEVSGVTLNDGDFIMISTYRPEMNFVTTSFSGFENETPATFVTQIAYPVYSDITVDYNISGTSEDATGSGTITISAGNTTGSGTVTVNDDATEESDETIIMTLDGGTVSAGIVGAQSVSTYTINDNDLASGATVQFDAPFNYLYKKTITIDQDIVDGSNDLEDFPFLLNLTDDSLRTIANGGNVENANGYDIRFTYENSVSFLIHQIESYDATTGQIIAWIKLPKLFANSDTKLEMYYGNSSVATDPSMSPFDTAVYEAVYHLGNATDQTLNSNDGALNGDAAFTAGIIGDALTLDGTNDNVEIPYNSSLSFSPTDPITLSYWYKGTDTNAEILSQLNGGANNRGYAFRILGGELSYLLIDEFPGGSGRMIRVASASSSIATNDEWHHLTATYDGSVTANGVSIYIDGVLTATDNTQLNDNLLSTDNTDPGTPLRIGERFNSNFDAAGLIDEVRVVRTELSAEWVKTEFNNQDTSTVYITVGDESDVERFEIVEATDSLNLVITLDAIQGTNVTVDYAVASGSASTGSDYNLSAGTATIEAGDLSTIVTIDLNNDAEDESAENLVVQLSNSSATALLGVNKEIEIFLIDDDPSPTIAFVDSTVSVNEGASLNSLVLSLSAASGDTVFVDYTVSSITASEGSDYTFADGTFSILPGNTTAELSFNVIDDVDVEGVEKFGVKLSNPVNTIIDGINDSITVSINDNDNFGIDGPGGVGDADGTGTLVFWVIADSAQADGSNNVTAWPNEVGITELDMSPPVTAPTLNTNAKNGHAEISFANVNDVMTTDNTLSASYFPYNEATTFTVTRHDNLTQESNTYGQTTSRGSTVQSGTRFSSHMPWDGIVYFDIGSCCEADGRVQFNYQNDWVGEYSIFTWRASSTTGKQVWRNYDLQASVAGTDFFTDHTSKYYNLGMSTNDPFQGDILENIIYTNPLNDAQVVIVNNYLAAKYALAITNDYYAFETVHQFGVAGIGREDADNLHPAAKSEFVKISNATDLDDGEYVLFGHDNNAKDAWLTAEVPSALDSIRRLEREWRFDLEGSPGTISVGLDTTELPSLPTDYVDYVILIDDDGDFSSGATIYPTSLIDGEYTANDVAVQSGSYMTIGVHIRTLAFLGTEIQDFENNNNNLSVTLSLESKEDISLSYVITGTATQGTDYSLPASGTITILAGNVSQSIDLGIIDDADGETDETIIITLSGAPAGIRLGADSIFTYTVNDDDIDRSINFDHFNYKREIVIDGANVSGSSDLIDFPLLFSITNDSLKQLGDGVGTLENDFGYDIAFYDSITSQFLEHQLELYDSTTGTVTAWVKVPTLNASSNTSITFMYGNAGITFDQSSKDVWRSEYRGVWHLGEGQYTESTSNSNNGVNQGSIDTTGIIGRASYMDGISNVEIANNASLLFDYADPFTLSAWYKGTDATGKTIVGLKDANTNDQGYDLRVRSNGQVRGEITNDAGNDFRIQNTNVVNDDNWYHVVMVYNGSGVGTAYVNGSSAGTNTTGSTSGDITPSVPFTIGSRSRGAAINNAIVGFVDEVRLYAGALDADWIATEYSNQNAPGSFYSVSAQDTVPELEVDETDGTITVRVRVDPVDETGATTINYSNSPSSTATITEDFTLTPATLNIPIGNKTGTFTFTLINDLIDEVDETVVPQISTPSANSKLGTVNTITYTIIDDDEGPAISFVDTVTTVNEGSSLVPIPVQLANISGNTVSVDYEVKAGTATSGTDYVALSGTLNIAPGDLSNTISFQPIDDPDIEDPETIVVRLFNPVNGTIAADSINTITINDNDDLGFEGPGGVGDVENELGEGLLKIWLIADSANVSSGTSVSTWPNEIENVSVNYDLTTTTAAPDLIDNQLNGHKVIRFNNANDALVSESLSAASFPGNEMTAFIVTVPSSLSQDSYVYATDDTETGVVDANSVFSSIPNSGGDAAFSLANDQSAFAFNPAWAGTHSIFTHVVSSDTFLVYRNNGVAVSQDPAGNTFTGHTAYDFYVGKSGTAPYEGEIAEIIMFSRELNLAQTTIVNNYLAAKYNLTVSGDIYNFDVTHGVDVAGIGRVDANNEHVAARAGIITISNASALGDGDYVLFGHDNGAIGSWTDTESPQSGVLRTEREWRFDTTGTPGAITIAIDTALLPSRITGDEDYVVIVDADGDFSSGSTIVNTTLVDGQFKAADVAINSGDYVTIGIFSRQIEFVLSSSNAFEDINSTVEVSLSLVDDAPVTLDYEVTGGTATGSNVDYSLASSGTLTFLTGQTSINIPLGIINDSDLESDETIIITLRNAPVGISLGADSVHTYTINDDDNTRKINFSVDSIVNSETVDSIYIVAEINEVDAVNPTKGYVSITGGTAESSPAPDYSFTADSVIIAPGETTDSILFVVLNDVLAEDDETVLFSISSPENAGLGDTATLVYTIIDNDDAVVATLQDTVIDANEGSSVVPVVVELDNVSGKDITVNYTIVTASSTATGGGTDYSLNDGSIVISTGDQFETINIALTDDAIEEAAETIVIAISGDNVTPNNADTVVITITDNDALSGYYGPGGVGDNENNLLWLDATNVNGRDGVDPIDGSTVSTWTDNSGNEHDFTAVGTNPTYEEDGFNLEPTVKITSGQSGFNAPLSFSNPLSNYSIFSVVEQTGGQYLSESNSSGAGNFRVNQGTDGLYAYSDINYLAGNSSTSRDVMTWMLDIGETNSAVVYRDGTSIASDNNFNITSLSSNMAIGNRHQSETQANSDFVGNISEYIIYNDPVNEAQRIIVENYLAAKYGLTIANDLYDFQGTFGNDVVGIGDAGVLDRHLEAMSDSILLLGGASDLDSGEFVFAGHDNANATSWTTFEAPLAGANVRRLAREWRIDTVGNPGTITLSVDIDELPAQLSEFKQYVIWTDSDGDFNNGATLYQLDFSPTSGLYVSDPITVTEGTYVTIGIIKPVVAFTLTASDSVESYTNPKIQVSLNFTRDENVTVNYAATGGTATGGNIDYLLASGTLTIAPGNMTADINLGIINDVNVELDETIEITLSSPSSNISLGSNVAHTYTILDDDSENEVNFFFADSTNSESVALVSPVIILTDSAQTDSIASDGSIFVTVTVQPASTATETEDFNISGAFVSNQLFIPNGDSVVSFNLDIIDDAIFEGVETVVVRITSSNVNVGAQNTFTYSITDNDAQPKVQFANTGAFGEESITPVQLEVVLDQTSGSEVTVDYAITSTTGTDGTDFNLSDGTLTFPIGDIEESILLTINDDAVLESAETVEITLSNAVGATLDDDSIVFVYTILDDDATGSLGPGGVGDSATTLSWLRGDNYNGVTWSDISGNSDDGTIITGAPVQSTGINGRETLTFDGDDGIDIDALTSGLSDYDIFIVYDADAGADMTLLESVNGSGDTLALVHNGSSGAFYDGSDTWIGSAITGTDANILEFSLQSGTGNASIKQTAASVTSQTGLTYTQSALSGEKAIGSTADVPLEDFFSGDIAEVIVYNTTLNTAQRKIVENYLALRYGLTPESDLYDETGGFTEELAGIGQEDALNLHTSASSEGIVTISDANALGDGDYLLFANDGGSIGSWVTTEQPNSGTEHLTREWKVDITGTPGTVTVTIDTADLPARSTNFTTYVLLVDGDGDFSDTDSIYVLTLDEGSVYEVNGVSFNDGDFFTIAAVQNATNADPAGSDFSDPATWASGKIPGAGESIIISPGDSVYLTQDVVIGEIIQLGDGAVLNLNGFTLSMDVGCVTLDGTGRVDVSDPDSKVEYIRNGDQCVTGMEYANLDLETAGRKFLLGNIDVNGDLNITDNAVELDITASIFTINIAGDWISTGSFTERSGDVIFDGTTNQSIDVDGGEVFADLEINKASGNVVLASGITIDSTLIMTLGNLDMDIHNVEMGAESTISGGDATSYIIADNSGVLRYFINTLGELLTLPVGDNDDYSPFTLRLNSGTLGASAAITINLRDAVHTSIVESNYISRFWSVNQESISGTIDYDVTYQYTNADIVGLEAALQARKFSGSGDAIGGSVNTATNTLSFNGHTSFSDHTGEGDGALPVELLYFKANLNRNKVVLEWSTLSEIDNDYFEVMRSVNGVDYKTLQTIDGHGTTTEVQEYKYVDLNPQAGVNYYRLKQVDFDGAYEFTSVVSVDNSFLGKGLSLLLYPNPTVTSNINLRVSGLSQLSPITLKLVSQYGIEYYRETVEAANGDYEIKSEELVPGVYYLIYTQENVSKTLKLVIR